MERQSLQDYSRLRLCGGRGHLIKQQMQLQAIIELDKEWNSTEMLAKRKAAWTSENEPAIDDIESVLEFLEKVSTFEKEGVISPDLIWDTFGWYVSRYYCYSKAVIKGIRGNEGLRRKWTPTRDD